MSFLNRITDIFRRKPAPTQPNRPPVERSIREHSFAVTEDGLKPQVRSLDEYYSIQEIRNEADEILSAMRYADTLCSEDGSVLDKDGRDKHVVIPEHGFESHPETGHKLVQGRVQLQGDQHWSRTTEVEDSWRAKNQAATWDKENQEFHYHCEVEQRALSQFGKGPKHKISGGQFSLTPDGKVELPQAVNLEQAKTQSEAHANAQRANDILESFRAWEAAAISQDKSPQDLDSRPGFVVAPQVDSDATQENVLSQTFTWDGEYGDEEFHFSGFDLEKTDRSLLVAGSHGGENVHGARLIAEKGQNALNVVVERPEVGTIERVEWKISEGTLNYEKLKKG